MRNWNGRCTASAVGVETAIRLERTLVAGFRARGGFLALLVAAAFLLSAGAETANAARHHPTHKVHRKHVPHSSPPYGALTPSVLRAPSAMTPVAPAAGPAPPRPPTPEARPALITPGAPAYAPGILVPGPPGTIPQCAPLSRSQELC
jgi:hypothetical protein